MSAKLIVHKFESEYCYKTLQIPIDEPTNGSLKKCKVYSHKDTYYNKNLLSKSRLVVKLATPNEISHFNLDLCARRLRRPLNNENDIEIVANKYLYLANQQQNCNDNKNNNVRVRSVQIVNSLIPEPIKNHSQLEDEPQCYQSPLEYSLERVKENNARIMENIKLLNRTLSYTKGIDVEECTKPFRSFRCSACGKCFVYETGLKRHYTARHALAQGPPNWQTVWTCIECFLVWPRQDIAEKHATYCCKHGDADRVREIKTSSLLQCEFCEKVFTSIPRLLKHSKSHTTAKNYECNACKLTFEYYRAFEQHCCVCSWQWTYYNFSLSKLLLCNTCDRKFKTYEQLYNHR